MLGCGFCGKSIGHEPPNSYGIEMIALIQHEKNKHWRELEELRSNK